LDDKVYFDKNTMARAPSYAFYETKEVLDFIRLNDYKEALCKRVLKYLQSIEDYLRLNPDPKAFVLRKSLVLLKRKQKAIDQKEYETLMFKDSPEAEEHLKTLFEYRNKLRNPSPKRGWTYWLSFGCVKSKSQTP
jgi:diadenosine tetraphosphate (Ap4A) HIT family hydrolase